MNPSHMASEHLPFRFFVLLALLLLVTTTAYAAIDPLLTTPPAKPLRMPAEFEPMQAVIVFRGFRDAHDLLEYVSEQVTLIMLSDQEEMPPIPPEYDVNMANCEFYQIASDFLVPRDELPWFIFADHNEPTFIHNHRETSRYAIPEYGLEQGYPVHRSGLEIDGGNFMTDGQGTAVSLETYYPNGKKVTPDEGLTELAMDYWGVHTHHLIRDEVLSPDYYFHVDCLAKFLAPDTIMVARVPASHDCWNKTEETAAYFRRQVSCYGTPYKVVRVDTPGREPYVNSPIVNHRVYVPTCTDRPEANADAIASYEAAMPGYEVIGISKIFGGIDSWLPDWALHCDTMGIPDEQMLYIEHTPVLDRPSTSEGFPIVAKIIAHSQTEFVEGTPIVLWRTLADVNEVPSGEKNSAAWSTAAMARQSGLGEHQFLAYIPAQPVGTVIQYYLRAQDGSGRDETHPYIGAAQAHTFTVTTLGANVSAVSARRGGTIAIYMNAGIDNARRSYHLAYSIAADSPPEGPTATLPETTELIGFDGVLDDSGIGTAQITIPGPLTSDWVGRVLCLSLALDDQEDGMLDTVCIGILE